MIHGGSQLSAPLAGNRTARKLQSFSPKVKKFLTFRLFIFLRKKSKNQKVFDFSGATFRKKTQSQKGFVFSTVRFFRPFKRFFAKNQKVSDFSAFRLFEFSNFHFLNINLLNWDFFDFLTFRFFLLFDFSTFRLFGLFDFSCFSTFCVFCFLAVCPKKRKVLPTSTLLL